MSPRPYRLGKRQAAADETRSRILAAARDLLGSPGGLAAFTIDAVARRAGVARMTVYYQFGSKSGLLEALFDDVAARGGMQRLAAAFARPEPLDTLAGFVAAFAGFWAVERRLHRRIHGLAALDAEVDRSLRAREEWRREGLRRIVRRLRSGGGGAAGKEAAGKEPMPDEEVVDVLFMLTSFETFDQLAGGSGEASGGAAEAVHDEAAAAGRAATAGGRRPEDVARLMEQLARAALGLPGPGSA